MERATLLAALLLAACAEDSPSDPKPDGGIVVDPHMSDEQQCQTECGKDYDECLQRVEDGFDLDCADYLKDCRADCSGDSSAPEPDPVPPSPG